MAKTTHPDFIFEIKPLHEMIREANAEFRKNGFHRTPAKSKPNFFTQLLGRK